MHKKIYEGRTQKIFITTIGTAKTRRVSHPTLKPNGWIMIVQSILQVGVNSADSTEFTGPVEYPLSMCTFCGSSCVLLYHVYYYKIVGVAVLAFRLSLLLPTIK